MAAWVLQHYQEVLGAPSKVAYIELGPGNGTLAKQILSALTMMPGGNALLAAMRIHMVEVSPGLRAMQAEALNCKETTAVLEVRPCISCRLYTTVTCSHHHRRKRVTASIL